VNGFASDKRPCPVCHQRFQNVIRHLKANRRCHAAVVEGRLLVSDAIRYFTRQELKDAGKALPGAYEVNPRAGSRDDS